MLVPNSQACANQFSSTSPIPASQTAAALAKTAAIIAAVGNAQRASDSLLVANPWESWPGGINLMRDVQRGNTQVAGAVPTGTPQLPGLPPAGQGGSLWDRMRRNVAGSRGNRGARQNRKARGWNSRFVTGPGGKFQSFEAGAANAAGADCTMDAADVVPSDGILPPGAPELQVAQPPAGPALRSDQPQNLIIAPPAAYAPCSAAPRTGNLCADLKSGAVLASTVTAPTLYACSQAGYAGVGPTPCAAGMGEWSASIAKPGAVPSECLTGAAAQPVGPGGFPWWLWALAGIAVVAVASTETKTRRAGGG